MSVESPHYETLRRDGSFEVRRYDNHVIASVHTSAPDPAAATSRGFNALADYIFGNNRASDRISMTAPVTAGRVCCQRLAMTAPVTAEKRENDYVVSFSMPSRYSMEELPRPNNPDVELEEVPAHQAAVVRFSGHVHGREAAQAQAKLQAWTEAQGLTPVGEPMLAQYDAPWKPGFARHNEILIPIADSPDSSS